MGSYGVLTLTGGWKTFGIHDLEQLPHLEYEYRLGDIYSARDIIFKSIPPKHHSKFPYDVAGSQPDTMCRVSAKEEVLDEGSEYYPPTIRWMIEVETHGTDVEDVVTTHRAVVHTKAVLRGAQLKLKETKSWREWLLLKIFPQLANLEVQILSIED